MRHVSAKLVWAALVVAALVMASPPAFGQGGGLSTLSGVVLDSSKSVIPGADVVAKNNATGAEYRAVSDERGNFTIPGVSAGTYTVTVSLMGFKTFVAPDTKVMAATPAQLTVTLDVGAVTESVVVTGTTEMVQTQSAAVSTTLQVKQLQQLPLVTHTALDSLLSLPGVNTPYGGTSRSSRINGLGGASINITLDGLNVQDNRSKSDGFFMYIRPMNDSVEEITVSTSTPGAEAAGEGAANIRMVTRSGSNRFSGAAYDTWRNQAGLKADDMITRTGKQAWYWRLNTPYYFNKINFAKTAGGDWYFNDARVTTPGVRVGGPIMKDKLFYFFNIEQFNWPAQVNSARYLLNTKAQFGDFTYVGDDKNTYTVNLLTIAAKYGVPGNTLDPSIAKLLADIRQAATSESTIETWDSNTDRFNYIPGATQTRLFPTGRIDWNLAAGHRVSGTFRYNRFVGTPDVLNGGEARWPGFPNVSGQNSDRYMWQTSYRGTFGKNIVDEANFGYVGAFGKGTGFGLNITQADFNCSGLGCQSVGGQGFNYGFPSIGTSGINGATTSNGPNADVAPRMDIDDTVTWLKGKHTFSFGGAYSRVFYRRWAQTMSKNVGFGIPSTTVPGGYLDPAYGVISSTNKTDFPGGLPTSNYQGWARNLYALLTGRVNSVGGSMYLDANGQYHYNGEQTRGAYRDNVGLFVSDSWRVKPNLTLTYGVRYEMQFPGVGTTAYANPQQWEMVYGITGAAAGESGSGNLYLYPKPMTGTAPLVNAYDPNVPVYKTDWNNFAPALGLAWRPKLNKGFLSAILSTDPVFRGGYSMTFTKYGIELFNAINTNPGSVRVGSRSETTGVPYLGAESGTPVWPVLLSQTSRLAGSNAYPEGSSPAYPLTPATNESIRSWDPEWQVPYVHQYSFGFQRELGKSMALEVRYVGNTTIGGWQTWSFTSTDNWNIKANENGYLGEFEKARQNLHANILAGRGGTTTCPGCTFAYYGPGTGTTPLPIFMAFYKGIPLADARNLDAAQYTSVTQFSTDTYYNRLGIYNPDPGGFLGTGSSGLLYGLGTAGTSSATGIDNNRVAAGIPINFFTPNPTVYQGNAYIDRGTGNTRFNSVTMELRRRMSAGLLVQGSYTYQFGAQTYSQNSLRESWYYLPASNAPIHSLKGNWVYELPFGQGKKWGSGAGRWKDMLIGGWEFDGVIRLQSGSKYNFGGSKLVGMTEEDVQKMFKFYHRADSTGTDRIYMWPEDVIINSSKAYNQRSATTATGYVAGQAPDPAGRYFAPASDLSCTQYVLVKSDYCSGTQETRYINGPWFFKTDFSFVKRFTIHKNMRLEARMELFNVFDTINLIPNSTVSAAIGTGTNPYSSWTTTSAATDFSASQDPGGRITQFGLRFTW
jgi:hypothetical protein